LVLRRKTRRDITAIVNKAKNDWITTRCNELNGDSDNCSGYKNYWTAARDLIRGLEGPKTPKKMSFRKADGELATSDAENLEVYAPYCEKLYNRESRFDPKVLDELEQRPIIHDLSDLPTDDEIKAGIAKLKSGKSGGFGQPAEALKITAESKEGFAIVKGFLLDFWDSEMAPDNWVTLSAIVRSCRKKAR
jgi:hypothetical protein